MKKQKKHEYLASVSKIRQYVRDESKLLVSIFI